MKRKTEALKLLFNSKERLAYQTVKSRRDVGVWVRRERPAAEGQLMGSDILALLEDPTRQLEAIVNNTTMAIFVMDDHQHCIFANRAAERLTGYSFSELQGQPLHDVIHNKYPDGRHYPLEECPIDQAFPERAQMQGQETFVHKDGSFFPVAFTASPIAD